MNASRCSLSIAPCITNSWKEALNTTVTVLLKNVNLNLTTPLDQGSLISPLLFQAKSFFVVGALPTDFPAFSGIYQHLWLLLIRFQCQLCVMKTKNIFSHYLPTGVGGTKLPPIESHCSRFIYKFSRST